jgi:hypothetical protein
MCELEVRLGMKMESTEAANPKSVFEVIPSILQFLLKNLCTIYFPMAHV